MAVCMLAPGGVLGLQAGLEHLVKQAPEDTVFPLEQGFQASLRIDI